MTDTSTLFGGRAPGNANTFNTLDVGGVVNFPIGTPVCPSDVEDSAIVPARANSLVTAKGLGLAATAGVVGSRALIQYAGPLTLTTAQWDAITGGSGGLTRGVPYYLSPATAGRLTTTKTVVSNQFVVPIGIALSATDLLIQTGSPVKNP